MPMFFQYLPLLLFIGAATAGEPYAKLDYLRTSDLSSSLEHDHFTKCAGNLYFTITQVVSSENSVDGLYRFDESNLETHSSKIASSDGKIRGLTCHEDYLYYYKRVQADSGGTTWALFRYNLQAEENGESFITDAAHFSHDPLTVYGSHLFIGARGPKLYKLTLTTEKPQVGLVWEAPFEEDPNAYPEALTVHKDEQDTDLYFVASDDQGHPSFWTFNVDKDEAIALKDLALRTGDSKATIANMAVYKGPQDYLGKLYFSLGGFDQNDGHHRLATWDGTKMPVEKLVTGYDPDHMTVYKEKLYMVLRKPSDVSKYAVWAWNGRFVKEVFALPNKSKIKALTVWDDILVASGTSGPLVVWNGDVSAVVEVTTKLTDVHALLPYKGSLILAATEDPADKGNQMWSLSKGVWKSQFKDSADEKSKSSNKKPSDGDTSGISTASAGDDDDDDEGVAGNVAPMWSKEISGSSNGGGGGGMKAIIILLVLGFVGFLCWLAYKTHLRVGRTGFESAPKTTTTTWYEDDVPGTFANDQDYGHAQVYGGEEGQISYEDDPDSGFVPGYDEGFGDDPNGGFMA